MRFSPDQRERYSRHLQLSEIGEAGQARLAAARVLVVGAGGLGSPAVLFLAGAGVGTPRDRGLRPGGALEPPAPGPLPHRRRRGGQGGGRTPGGGRDQPRRPGGRDPVGRWTGRTSSARSRRRTRWWTRADNFETRFEVNAACVATGTPLVSGAAIRMEGQVAVFDPGDPESPCYRCVFDDTGDPEEPCALVGVFAPVAGIVGTIQAAEAVKRLAGAPSGLKRRLMLIDALSMEVRTVRVRRDPACPACGNRPPPDPVGPGEATVS